MLWLSVEEYKAFIEMKSYLSLQETFFFFNTIRVILVQFIRWISSTVIKDRVGNFTICNNILYVRNRVFSLCVHRKQISQQTWHEFPFFRRFSIKPNIKYNCVNKNQYHSYHKNFNLEVLFICYIRHFWSYFFKQIYINCNK